MNADRATARYLTFRIDAALYALPASEVTEVIRLPAMARVPQGPPALLGVGYIVGLNIGIVVVSGSILSWHIAIPAYEAFFLAGDPVLAAAVAGQDAATTAFGIWDAKIRYLGVGAMLIGGVWTLFSLRKSLVSGIRSGIAAARKGAGDNIAETERDLPMKWMLVALVYLLNIGNVLAHKNTYYGHSA